MARDKYHELVKQALIADGWTITDDPYFIKWSIKWQIDLGAEKLIGAEKENSKIAIEVKTFLKASFANEFHTVIGQYSNYNFALNITDKQRVLYLAIPLRIWKSKFQLEGIQLILQNNNVKIILYDIENETIEQWIG